jgi:hypothetical protein
LLHDALEGPVGPFEVGDGSEVGPAEGGLVGLVKPQAHEQLTFAQLVSVLDRSVAFTDCGQHGDRQTFEPAFPVYPFFAQHRLSIQCRPTRRLPDRLLTHHISPSPPILIGTGLSLSHKPIRRLERSLQRSRPAPRTSSRFQNPMCHTPDAPSEVARVGLTAWAACTPFGRV